MFFGKFNFFILLLLTGLTLAWHHPNSDVFLKTRRRFYKNPRNAPSEYCPRDEAQVQLQGRTCLRKCISDEDCKSKRKRCFCDGACGLSCVKPEKECDDPEPPAELGEVHITGKVFGSKAIYSCPEGYKVIGMSERVCQADGWSGSAPSCKKNIFCTQPPRIENARHNAPMDQNTFDLETSLQYQCHPGYSTKGFARTKCFFYNGTAKWFGPDITCEPKSCGEPPDILNGRKEGQCYHYSCKIAYACQSGFELLGRLNYYCGADGKWTPKDVLPSCSPVQCSLPTTPENGKAIYTSVSFNSLVSYECKYGYMIDGEVKDTRKCGPNKNWTGIEPKCKEIKCPNPGIIANGWLEGNSTSLHASIIYHCFEDMTLEGDAKIICTGDGTWSSNSNCLEINCKHPGWIANGWIENLEGGTNLGASIIFRCYDGMTLVGHTSSVCSIDGKWSYPLPKCQAPCTVPIVAYGNVTTLPDDYLQAIARNETVKPIMLSPGTIISHGKVIGIDCEKQFEPAFNITPTSCYNGSWTNEPKCQPARCRYLPKPPKHGMVIAPKTEHGMKARFQCRDGYILVGNNITECQYGNWIMDNPPVCNQTYCKFPGSIANGRVLLVGNMGLYDYRNYVTKVANNRQIMFECNRGYVLSDGPLGKTCLRGEWAPKTDPPRCIQSQHPSFRWIRSVRQKRRAIKGGSSIVGKGGSRGGGGGIGTRRGGKKRGRGGGGGGIDSLEYEPGLMICDDLNEDPFIEITVIEAGEEENSTFSNGSVVKVSCTYGYGVNIPNETITCINGRWKPKDPICNALPCKVPFFPNGLLYENGNKLVYFQEPVKHAKNVEIKCKKGHELHGPSMMPCWYGEWSIEVAPVCQPVKCTLPNLDFGNYVGHYRPGMPISHDTEVDYVCGGDYRKIGPARCQRGEWKPQKPHCLHPGVSLNYSIDASNMADSINYEKRNKDGKEKDFFKRGCSSKPKITGAITYFIDNAEPIPLDHDSHMPDGTEILYRCVSMKPKSKNRWRMTCNDGKWDQKRDTTFKGSAQEKKEEKEREKKKNETLDCEGESTDLDVVKVLKMLNGSCHFKKKEKDVVTFNDDEEVQEAGQFTQGTILVSRCVDIGKYQLQGNVRIYCINGQFIGQVPKCEGLNQLHDLSLDRSPTILFRYENGSISQSNDGILYVYPGTTVHMECLWIRKFGRPNWKSSSTHREYIQNWTDGIADRQSDLEYRLTIDNAQEEDSGNYSCTTPGRHGHTIDVIVKGIDCNTLPEHPDLIYSTDSTALGTRVTFKCRNGNALVGAQELECKPNGVWSHPLPKCENIECPDISLLPALSPNYSTKNLSKHNETAPPKITVLSKDVGGRTTFSCPQGFTVVGQSDAICKPDGTWSSPIPICKEVECPEPEPPENGIYTGNPPYKSGALVQFDCNQGYMIEGTPIRACQDSGKWSKGDGIKCVQACTYPGTTIGGTISRVKFYYAVGETVNFDCTPGYKLTGARLLHCLKSGKWSNSIPTCTLLNNMDEHSEDMD